MPEELIERLISFETAKLAKEKGFDPENKLYSIVDIKINGVFPTQALVQKWLREKFNLVVEVEGINWAFDKSFIKYYVQRIIGAEWTDNDDEYNTYEDALEEGLLEALNMIVQKENK